MDNRKMVYSAVAASFAAFVAGLNLGGISGALDYLISDFSLTPLQAGFVTSIIMIGCLFGALSGGTLSDRYGRVRILSCSVFIIMLFSLLSAFSSGVLLLVISRFFIGTGMGVLSTVIPVYVSEISPAKWRGTLVSLYQMFIVTGILIAYLLDFMMMTWADNWRWMLGVPAAASVLSLVFLAFIPESPVWSARAGKRENDSVSWKTLTGGVNGKILILGILLAAFQQITGINVVINYAPGILKEAGIGGDAALLQSVYVGIVNFVFTILAVWLVDRLGRKKILIAGCAGLVVSLAFLVYEFMQPEANNIAILAAILMYIAFFAMSLSPLMFVVTSEIYPSSIRGTAMAVSTGVSWICAFLVVQLFPVTVSAYGPAAVFGAFCILCLAAMIFIWIYIPETKGKSLDEIENYLQNKLGK